MAVVVGMSRVRRRWVVIFLTMLVCACATPEVSAKKYVRLIKVRSSTGTVKVWRHREEQWVGIVQEMHFYPHDQIMTGGDGEVTLYFQDRSEMFIRENTLVSMDELSIEKSTATTSSIKRSIFTLWIGTINSRISRLGSDDRFELHTPAVTCAIRGTEFSVEVGSDHSTTVAVQHGLVGVRDAGGLGDEVMVEAGFSVTAQPGVPVPEPETIPDDSFEDLFKDEPEDSTGPAGEVPSRRPPASREGKPGVTLPEPPPSVPGGIGKISLGKWVSLSMNGALGAVILTDPVTGENRVYSKISLMPELSIWKIGVGFDFYFYFDENNSLRDEDWDQTGDILRKIWYVRFGKKGDPLYAYIGGLRNTTIGHGLIMNNYTNMLQYPDMRKTGAILSADLGSVGFESMVSDIDQAELYGGRVFARPLHAMNIPLVNRIAIAASGVTDRDPDSDDTTRGDAVSVYGVDVELPVFSHQYFSVMVYADGAQMDIGERYTVNGSSDEGRGYAAGVQGNMMIFSYRAEYRRFENNFTPSYFDTFYDRDRFDVLAGTGKADRIASSTAPILEGPYGELGVSLFSLVSLRGSYEDYNKDPFAVYPYVHGELTIDPRLLLNRFTFTGYYDKRNVDSFNELKELAGALVTAEIGYRVAPNITIVMIRRQQFNDQGAPTRTVEIETRIQF